MGIREVRFCDLTGSEEDVAPHEIQIDQLRVEIDLADKEYRRLIEILQPYMDAGRLEASAPDHATLPGVRPRYGANRGSASGPKLTPAERKSLRRWAEGRGIEVPSNNRFKAALVDQWRRETTDGP